MLILGTKVISQSNKYGYEESVKLELKKAEQEALNAKNSADDSLESSEKSKTYMIASNSFSETSKDWSNVSKIWAQGEDEELETIELGNHSSRVFANLSMAIANTEEDVPIDMSTLLASQVIQGEPGKDGEKGNPGQGLEIGDIGIAPLGIDESQNLRRYLNGQVISQSLFPSFTQKIKERIALYPSLSCNEDDWKTIVENSKLGQCGKFVIDDDLGTIRLPKVVNINGLMDLLNCGEIVDESLPNITGANESQYNINQPNHCKGAIESFSNTVGYYGGSTATTGWVYGFTFDASRSSDTYKDNAPVQQESVQYPYFIQVALSIETTLPTPQHLTLNDSNTLFDVKSSEYRLNNASWLKSEGQWNFSNIYSDAYKELLKEYNNPARDLSIKMVGDETIDDYDFVLNTSDKSFRLPLKSKVYESFRQVVEVKEPTDDDPSWYRLYNDGWLEQGGIITNTSTGVPNLVMTLPKAFSNTKYTVILTGSHNDTSNNTIGVQYGNMYYGCIKNSDKTTSSFQYRSGVGAGWYACGMAEEIPEPTTQYSLYYYVGTVLNNANMVDVGRITEELVNIKKEMNDKTRGYLVESFRDGHNWYRIYSDGWIEQGGYFGSINASWVSYTVQLLVPFKTTNYIALCAVGHSAQTNTGSIHQKTQTTVKYSNVYNDTGLANWYCCGY